LLVKIENLVWRFEMEAEPALNGVSLSIAEGEFVLIVGASGSGKSTLASCIKGIMPHLVGGVFEGTIEVDGVKTLDQPVSLLATRVGMVFQDPETQLCNLFIKDEIGFGPENLRVPPDLVRDRVRDALAFVGLSRDDLDQRFVYEVSGGQKQRIAIASVLAMQPPIVVFDEPTANLDPRGGAEVIDAIKRLHTSGHTVLVIEHRLDDLVDVADRMVVVREGTIILDGAPRELLQTASETLARECGVRIPQVCAIALSLSSDFRWDPFPLRVEELVNQTYERLSSAPPLSMSEPIPPAMSDDEPVAELKDAGFRYPDGTQALRGVSLTLNRGQTVAIAGTNGSGKTTLARMLVGLLRPTAGQVTVLGKDLSRLPTHEVIRQVGYVFQYPEHQFVKDRVFDEIAYGLEVQGFDPETVRQRTEHVLHLFGLERYRDRHPLRLSGGQKRKLSVATMLVLEPDVLILDEPTFGQDADSSRRMMEHLLGEVARRTDLTTIIITHDMDLVATYCDRLIVMSGGRIIGDGTPRALFQQTEVLQAGSLVRPPVTEYVARLRDLGVDVPAAISRVDEFIDWYDRARHPAPAGV
jgi:energy-coupling factor transporter ATP-binding protein EcfA2